jgi:Caspase domain/WD domain, G-beta repeat
VFALALSPDGAALATGGRDGVLRLWSMAGELQRELKGHSAAVRDAAFSPDGRLLASSSSDDTVRIWDVQSGREAALLKGHANRVNAVRFTPDGAKLVSAGEDSALIVWDVARGVQLAKLEGHKGPVKALAITADGRHALSASVDETLALWNLADGKLLARAPLQAGQLYAVAASPRGLVAAAGDGGVTVLAAVSDLAERVRAFGFTDGEWLSIVPAGLFHASPNGARYLNVRVGNEVFGLEQFLESFLRPETVMAALGGFSPSDERSRIRKEIIRVKPAPEVAIVGLPLEVASGEVNVRVRISDRGGGVGDVRLYLNDTAVVQDRTVERAQSAGERNYLVRLVAGRNVIRAAAFNADNSMQSADAVHELVARFAGERKPALHALVIGIQEFANPRLKLSYSVADANLFAGVLESRSRGLFESVNVRRLLTAPQTTRAAIIQAVAELRGKVGPDDLFVFYVASHGTVDEGEYFLLTSNVGSTATGRLRSDALSERDLRDLLANIPATKKLIVLDTCNAGRLGDVLVATRGLEEDRAAKVLSRAVGSTVLSAASSMQEAIEGYNGHGLFTYVVAEALAGKADYDRDGFVKTTELALYVDNEVPELAERVFRYKQFPIVSPTGMGFPVTRARGE